MNPVLGPVEARLVLDLPRRRQGLVPGQAASGPSRYTRVCRGGDAKTSFVG